MMLFVLSLGCLAGCQQEATLEGQETVFGTVELEADLVDLEVVSTWTEADRYGSSEFIDAHALVVNNSEHSASFTVALTMINEASGQEGQVEGEYKMTSLYTIEPGEEVEVYEGILWGPAAYGTCSWQVRVQVADSYKEDIDRENNKGRSNIFRIGS